MRFIFHVRERGRDRNGEKERWREGEGERERVIKAKKNDLFSRSFICLEHHCSHLPRYVLASNQDSWNFTLKVTSFCVYSNWLPTLSFIKLLCAAESNKKTFTATKKNEQQKWSNKKMRQKIECMYLRWILSVNRECDSRIEWKLYARDSSISFVRLLAALFRRSFIRRLCTLGYMLCAALCTHYRDVGFSQCQTVCRVVSNVSVAFVSVLCIVCVYASADLSLTRSLALCSSVSPHFRWFFCATKNIINFKWWSFRGD